MVTPRLTINLEPDERAALAALCEQDRRPPKWTIRWLVVQEAERRGLAKNEGNGDRLDNEPVTLCPNA